jgi:hypothetical protein
VFVEHTDSVAKLMETPSAVTRSQRIHEGWCCNAVQYGATPTFRSSMSPPFSVSIDNQGKRTKAVSKASFG